MTTEEHIDYWLESADNDLTAAENMLKAGNYDWCLFIGHLVLEKALKAMWVKTFNTTPIKIHSLTRLSELIKLNNTEEYEHFFVEANKFYLECRYPFYKNAFYKICSEDYATEKLNKIKEIFLWLKSLLK
jgi:HEPN domain-containing protein